MMAYFPPNHNYHMASFLRSVARASGALSLAIWIGVGVISLADGQDGAVFAMCSRS